MVTLAKDQCRFPNQVRNFDAFQEFDWMECGDSPCSEAMYRTKPSGWSRIVPAVHSAGSADRGSEAIFSPHKQNRTQRGRIGEPLDLTVVGGQNEQRGEQCLSLGGNACQMGPSKSEKEDFSCKCVRS
jgi:hypothetical protein